jgi:hypothetical protein
VISRFVPFNFRDDDDVTGNERTLEGYVEIFEMGQMDPDDDGFGEAAVHVPVASGPDTPEDCGALVDAWTSGGGNGEWIADNTGRLPAWNGGGLYGYGVVINPADGTAAGYDAIAIDDYFDALRGQASIPLSSGYVFPNFQQSNPAITLLDGATPVSMDFTGQSGNAAWTHWMLQARCS